MEIIVKGKAGEGKSAIVQVIAEALQAKGFGVEQRHPDHERTSAQLEKTLDGMARRDVMITIYEQQDSK